MVRPVKTAIATKREGMRRKATKRSVRDASTKGDRRGFAVLGSEDFIGDPSITARRVASSLSTSPRFYGDCYLALPGEDGARPTRPLSTKLPHSGRHRCELGDRWVQRTKWMPRSAATDRAWISMSLTNLLKRSLTATTSLLEIRSPFSGQSHLSLSEPMLPVASDNAETTALSSPLRSRSIRPDSPGAVALSP